MSEMEGKSQAIEIRLRPGILLLCLLALSAVWSTSSGCSVKKTVNVDIPPAIRQSKTASFEELLAIIHGYGKIKSLSSNDMELTFTSSRKRAEGVLERYRSLNGYILLQRPDSIHFVLLIPISRSTLFDVLSVGDSLSVWYPRENRFYLGRNSAKELIVESSSGSSEFSVPIRGPHLFEAIFPQSAAIDSHWLWVVLEEQTDEHASYYVLNFSREGDPKSVPRRIHILHKIWIERSALTIARYQVFSDEGSIVSDIVYSKEVRIDSFDLPLQIHIDRPMDGYTLDLTFKNWSLNPDLQGEAFKLSPPPGAEIIRLKEKGKSGVS